MGKALRWASVSAREFPTAGATRHLVRTGAVTSACGTTALPARTWRADRRKPMCQTCLDRVLDDQVPREPMPRA